MAVSVNVSARQFRERDLVSRVASALRESGLEARYLELELTESLIMQDVELAVATMKELQGLGVRLSIDDFGTRYSSLSALKTFPVPLEDRQVVRRRYSRRRKRQGRRRRSDFLRSDAQFEVIAEGVETEAQAAILRNINCDEMQGYLFSKPLPAQGLKNCSEGPQARPPKRDRQVSTHGRGKRRRGPGSAFENRLIGPEWPQWARSLRLRQAPQRTLPARCVLAS